MYRQDSKLFVTHHAILRGRKRLSWQGETLGRMAQKAYYLGMAYQQTKGRLRKYFDRICQDHGNAEFIRLYGENIFVFYGGTLVTIWQLPVEFRALASTLRQKQEKKERLRFGFPLPHCKKRSKANDQLLPGILTHVSDK